MPPPSGRRSMNDESPIARATSTALSDGPASEIFLSPRVIDRDAFNELAGSLRTLIEQAHVETESLRSAHAGAQSTQTQLREVAIKTQPRIDAAGKTLTALDTQSQRVEQLLASAKETASTLSSLSQQSQQLVAQAAADLHTRVDRLRDEQGHRLDEAREHLRDDLAKLSEENERRTESLNRQLDLARASFDALVTGIASENQRRAEDLRRDLDARAAEIVLNATQRMAETSALVDQGDARLEERLRRAEELMAQKWATINARLDTMEQDAQARAAEVVQRIQDVIARGEARFADLAQTIDNRLIQSWTHANEVMLRLDKAATRAERLLGLPDGSDPAPTVPALSRTTSLDITPAEAADACDEPTPSLATIHRLLREARELSDASRQTARDMESLREQTTQAQGILGQDLNEAAARIDALSQRGGDLIGELGRALEACDSAQALILRQRDELCAAVDEPARRLEAVGVGFRESIRSTLTDAEAQRRATQVAGEEASEVLVRLAALQSELKPWEPFLVNRAPGAAVPAPLQTLVESVRRDLATDLASIAETMRAISGKAQTAATRLASE